MASIIIAMVAALCNVVAPKVGFRIDASDDPLPILECGETIRSGIGIFNAFDLRSAVNAYLKESWIDLEISFTDKNPDLLLLMTPYSKFGVKLYEPRGTIIASFIPYSHEKGRFHELSKEQCESICEDAKRYMSNRVLRDDLARLFHGLTKELHYVELRRRINRDQTDLGYLVELSLRDRISVLEQLPLCLLREIIDSMRDDPRIFDYIKHNCHLRRGILADKELFIAAILRCSNHVDQLQMGLELLTAGLDESDSLAVDNAITVVQIIVDRLCGSENEIETLFREGEVDAILQKIQTGMELVRHFNRSYEGITRALRGLAARD